jgi:Holliday junction resolvase-like predicted endonuclease
MLNNQTLNQQSGLNTAVAPNNTSAYGFQEIVRPSSISLDYTPYEVKRGDTPSQIAESQLGNYRRWTEILQSDGTTITPEESTRIQIKEVLWIPSVTPQKAPVLPKNIAIVDNASNPIANQLFSMPEGYRKYIVQMGDTPSGIAESQLGNWRTWTEILQTDRTTITPEEAKKLRIGEELWLPLVSRASTSSPLESVVQEVISSSTDFYEYTAKSGDTNASIALKIYGDTGLGEFLSQQDGTMLNNLSILGEGSKVLVPISNLSPDTLRASGVLGLANLARTSSIKNVLGLRKVIPEAGSIAVKYFPAILKLTGTYLGRAIYQTGLDVEKEVLQALKKEGYTILPYNQFSGNRGFDAIVIDPKGDTKLVEVKTSYTSGKSFNQALGKAYGYKQTSPGWISRVAELSMASNNNPSVKKVLDNLIKNPDSFPFMGILVKPEEVAVLERPIGKSRFKPTGNLDLPGTTAFSKNRQILPQSAISNTDEVLESVAKGSSKASKVAKVLGPLGVAVGVAADLWTLKTAYDKDGGTFGETYKTEAAGVAGSWAGATSGAAFGATVGSLIAGPGVGTILGGVIGGIIGGIGGTDIGKDAYKSGVFKWWW